MTGGILPRRRDARSATEYMALVDILFAILGIIVVVIALQPVMNETADRPRPFDGLVLCTGSDTVIVAAPDAPPAKRPLEAVIADISAREIPGPVVLLGIAPPCALGDPSPARLLRKALDDAARVDRGETQQPYLFEMLPLAEEGPDGAEGVLERFKASDQSRSQP